jgi:Mrp family chromosome partitioning ATPase
MKALDDIPAMSDPVPPAPPSVHVVRPTALRHDGAPGGPPSPQEPALDGQPLRIDYSTTRVLPSARLALQGVAGVMQSDRSALAESYKMLRNQVLLRLRHDGHRLLAVTSPRPLRGKSLTALNLALAMAADLDTAVLLVDADLSGRGLQQWFGLGGADGLGEHLTQGTGIAELLVNPGIERFVFLPAGRCAGSRSAELLAARAAHQLVQAMKLRYPDRYIVIDLPPLLDTADALALLPQVDTTLLVVEAHSSSVADIEASADLLAPFPLIGSVLTQRPEPEPNPHPWYGRWWRRGRVGSGADATGQHSAGPMPR